MKPRASVSIAQWLEMPLKNESAATSHPVGMRDTFALSITKMLRFFADTLLAIPPMHAYVK
jgi:hypothetical protein